MESILQKLVSAEWLNDHLEDADLIILDASPKSNKSGLTSDFGHLQIKGARIFDIKKVFSDPQSDLPNTLPGAQAFAAASRNLGINSNSKIVVYDNLGIYTSPRVWWMFKTMGHQDIAVLNGGLPHWVAKGYDVEPIGEQSFETGNFEATFNPSLITSMEKVFNNLNSQNALVMDARSAGRFEGTTPEPRAGLSSGHIPQSLNLPFQKVLDNGFYKSKKELLSIFEGLNTSDKPLIFSCGSGITACIILLASELVSDRPKSVFDGSWTAWATSGNLPIEKT